MLLHLIITDMHDDLNTMQILTAGWMSSHFFQSWILLDTDEGQPVIPAWLTLVGIPRLLRPRTTERSFCPRNIRLAPPKWLTCLELPRIVALLSNGDEASAYGCSMADLKILQQAMNSHILTHRV